MNGWDIAVLIINVVLTIISGFGAYKSIRYFKKSRHITIYAQTNKALGEIGKMLKLLPEALAAASSTKKGFNPENAVCEKGSELANSLNAIMNAIPSEYSTEFRLLQKNGDFELEQYIYSFIDKTVIIQVNGRTTLDRTSFDTCQERLREMQEFLKKKIVEEENNLK